MIQREKWIYGGREAISVQQLSEFKASHFDINQLEGLELTGIKQQAFHRWKNQDRDRQNAELKASKPQ